MIFLCRIIEQFLVHWHCLTKFRFTSKPKSLRTNLRRLRPPCIKVGFKTHRTSAVQGFRGYFWNSIKTGETFVQLTDTAENFIRNLEEKIEIDWEMSNLLHFLLFLLFFFFVERHYKLIISGQKTKEDSTEISIEMCDGPELYSH